MRKLFVAALAAVILVPAFVATTASAATDRERIFGATRLETAVEISKVSFPDTSDVVYLARSDVFADALAAGTLTDGPVLLVPSCGAAPPVVTERIADLDPSEVIALGGTGAVCDEVVEQVAGGRRTGRIQGSNRFETAVKISQRAFPDGAEVAYVASGADTAPDAVSGGALTDGPILLVPATEGATVPTSVLAEITRLDPDTVYGLGGRAAVPEDVLRQAAGPIRPHRIAGSTRYETAVRIAERQFPADVPLLTAYLAQGQVFADAVAAGSLTDGPVLLVPRCGDVPIEVVDYLRAARPGAVKALGGQAAICDPLFDAAAQFTSNVDVLQLEVDGPELRLDATQEYVLVTDVPMGQVSLVFHDYSRGFEGQVSVETFDQDNESVFRSRLRDSDATNTVISDQPGRYITRLIPNEVEDGAQIRAVATSWKDPGIKPDVGNLVHAPDRFGSGLTMPITVANPRSWQWMSATVIDNIIDVYSGRASLQVAFPDGSLTREERFSTDANVSLRWPVHEAGPYELYVDPKENRIRTTLSADTWEVGTTSLASPPFTFDPDRVGDGGTWRYQAGLRRWHTIVGYGPPPEGERCVFELASIDRHNEQLEETRCDSNGVAAITLEPTYAGDYAALVHTLATYPIRVEVTPWAEDSIVINQTTTTIQHNGLRGRGGVVHFEGDISRPVTVRVDHPDAEQRPNVRLERPSGVFLDPRATDRQASYWEGDFELTEEGQYTILVDTLGYPIDFTVSVSDTAA